MTIALVGGSGLVGTALLERLLDDGRDVLVVDRAVPRRAVAWAALDLLRDDVEDALAHAFRSAGVDVVVHLAARVAPPRDAAGRARMGRLHEHGTRAVAQAARRAGVRRLVLVSSAVVYGAWPDNPVPLTEDAPVRPCDFPYALDKALQEQVCRAVFGADGLVVVRPAIVYAPQAKNYLTEIVRRARLPVGLPGRPRGVLPALDGHRPPLQFVHVDDVAAVLAAAVTRTGVQGVFHACPSDWLSYAEVAAIAELAVVDVDAARVGSLLDRSVRFLPPWLRAPSSLMPYLKFPFVLSSTKTTAALGVTPTRGSADALRAMLGRVSPGAVAGGID